MIQEFVVRLISLAPDCEFTFPNCTFDLQSNHIRDQFIRGLYNETLQADILGRPAASQRYRTLSNTPRGQHKFK